MKRVLAIAAMFAFALPAHDAWAQIYVRADLGGAFSTNTDFTDVSGSPNPLLGPGVKVSGDAGDSFIFGAGVGARFSPLLRIDGTLSYMPSFSFKGTDNVGLGSSEKADVDSLVGLVNGYLDLNGLVPGMFGAFQPYVDAGVGFAHNHVGTTSGSVGGIGFTVSDNSHTSFAWGAGAGIAYPIMPTILLDLSYKYLDLGEMRTGTTVGLLGIAAPVGQTKADLHAHTVTLGVRMGF